VVRRLPPTWVLGGSTRLSLEDFFAEFSRAWSRTESRFLKLECWQSYREVETNRSQMAYEGADIGKARELLKQEAEADRPLYEDVRSRDLEYSRIRLLREPLTSYLEYELLSYQIRAEMGGKNRGGSL